MSITDVSPVDEYSVAIRAALARAREAKPPRKIDPILASPDLEECIGIIESTGSTSVLTYGEARTSYAAIETACRDIFYNLLVSRSITIPVKVADRTSPCMR